MKDRLTPWTFTMWLVMCVVGYALVVHEPAPQAKEVTSMCEYERYANAHADECK